FALGVMARDLLDGHAAPSILDRATSANPSERHHSGGELVAELDRATGGTQYVAHHIGTVRNPYKGLRAFEEADAEDFHGREGLVEKLVETVATSRWATVVGPSGSGKSSLVQAGLLPALRNGAVAGSDRWLSVVMTPGPHPLEALAATLGTLASRTLEPETLTNGGLEATTAQLLEDTGEELVVVIDQFEEVFTLVRDPSERQAFLSLLLDAVEADGSLLRVVTTLRADLYDRPLSDSRLGPHLRDGQVTLLRPSHQELVEMIVTPARSAGLGWEAGLPERIALEIVDQPGGLPLLQYALTELVENRQSDLLTTRDYERIGGVSGALAGRAEAVYSRLPPHLRIRARDVLLRLVTVDEDTRDTRRRVRHSELESLGITRADLDRILTPFITERLLAADRDPTTRGPTVEVAHEALLREWPRLRSWISDERESLIVARKLRAAIQEWERADQDPDFLPSGSRLSPFQPLLESTALAENERSFLETALERDRASRTARRRRRRLLTGVLTATTALALVLAGLAISESRRAAVEAERASASADLARARELAASAISVLNRDPELSVLLAAQATETAEPSFETVSALHEALYHHRLLWTVDWPGDPSFFTGALGPDGTRLVLAGIDRLQMWDVETRNLVWEKYLSPSAGLHITPFFSRDGAEVVALVAWPRQSARWDDPPAGANPGIYRWSSAGGDEIGYTPGGECPIFDIGQFGPSIDPHTPVLVAGFAPRGSGCDRVTGTVALVDLIGGEVSPVSEVDLAGYRSGLSTSADARYLAFTESNTAVVTSATGQEIARPPVRTHTATLTAAGDQIVLHEFDSTVSRWDVGTNTLIGEFGETLTNRVQFDAEGSHLIHYNLEGEIGIWDTASRKEIGRLIGAGAPPVRTEIGAFTTSVDRGGARVASFSANGSARVWSTAPLGEVGSFPVGSSFVTASSLTLGGGRGALLVYPTEAKGGTAAVFEVPTGERVARIPNAAAQTVRLSPDGTRLAAQYISDEEIFGPVQIHDLESGETTSMEGMCDWPYHTEHDPQPPCVAYPDVPFQEWTRDLAFSPDGSLLAHSGAMTGSITVWGTLSGEMLFNSGRIMPRTEQDPQFDGPTLAFEPVGDGLVVSTRDELLVYSTTNWKMVEQIAMPRMTRLVFAPDGKHLVGATPESDVVIVDPESWEILMTLTGHNSHIQDLAVSPDQRLIASADQSGSITVWELA
ncbi:MAG: hypothetical protein ACOCUZ_00920, partial [bacterium]